LGAYLDIYGLTSHRDAGTINRFIDTFVDYAAAEVQLGGDEELMIVPLGRKHHANKYLFVEVHQQALRNDAEYRDQWYEYELEPALSLAKIVKRGLDHPRRSFTIYLPHRREDLHLENSVIISFTVDDRVIFGLGMRDTEKNIRRARRDLLPSLMSDYTCHMGMIAVEFAPPISEPEFRESKHDGLVLYFIEGNLEIVK
jgi:hypothetical protein